MTLTYDSSEGPGSAPMPPGKLSLLVAHRSTCLVI